MSDSSHHPDASRPRSAAALGWWLAVFAGGLCSTLVVVPRVIYWAEGYDAGEADCDDCGVTLLLDNIGWLALADGAYLALFYLGLRFDRQRRRVAPS